MSKLNRAPGMPLQVPLYKLKSSYELLLGISFSLMDADTVLTRSDSYAMNSAKHFISKNTSIALDNYVQLKMTKGEKLNVMLVCQMVARHEANVPSDQISTTLILPEHCTRLDTQMVTASNVEELYINSSEFQRNRSRDHSGSRRDKKSPAKYNNGSKDKPRNGSHTRYWRSPGGTFRPSRSAGRGQSPSGTSPGRRTSSTPQGRRGSRQRFTSKHGRRYSKSPGGNSWHISSRSPTRRPANSQVTRGRPGHPSNTTGCPKKNVPKIV